MEYAVRIMNVGPEFNYVEGKRYKAKKSILRFLIKNNFAFTFGIANNYVEKKPHYICVYLKSTHLISCGTMEKSEEIEYLNKKLMRKLK